MTDPQSPKAAALEEDPIYRHSVREARFILGLWTCCFFYTVIYCYLNGYITHEAMPEDASAGPSIGNLVGPLEKFNRDPATVTYPLGLGIPDWVFYGVALPWVVCIVLSFWFCLAIFVEDDLTEDAQATDDEVEGSATGDVAASNETQQGNA